MPSTSSHHARSILRHRLAVAGPVAVALAMGANAGAADLTVNPMFSDGCVLQENQLVPVWGTGLPGYTVFVNCAGRTATTAVTVDGSWMARLPSVQAGGPYSLDIVQQYASATAAGVAAGSITVKDVLVGEVWICSGQSNMEWPVAYATNGDAEVKAAHDSQIRVLKVDRSGTTEPQQNIHGGTWAPAVGGQVGGFSGVGYFFGRNLREKLHVPIGLIGTYWGGTSAETWTSLRTMSSDPSLSPIMDRDRAEHTPEATAKAMAKYQAELARWESFHKEGAVLPDRQIDPGIARVAKEWAEPACDDHDWETITLPGLMDGSKQGAYWFRKTVQIPPGFVDQDLDLALGAMDDFDVTFVNGTQVGATGKETAEWWNTPRTYHVPAVVAGNGPPGQIVIAVRIFNDFGSGGISGPAMRLRLSGVEAGEIRLEGSWRTRAELALDPMQLKGAGRPQPPGSDQNGLAGLYNGMIHPLAPYAIAGVVWFQGENNAGNAGEYRHLLPALIGDWRRTWGQGDFPFGIVQLANVWAPSVDPGPSRFASLREAQAMTAQHTPHTGLAITIDVGEAKTIHPRNKQEVGRRLSLWALSEVYHQPIVFSGPVFKAMTIDGDHATITFDHPGGGLVAKDDSGAASATAAAGAGAPGSPLKRFEIAGADRHFVWADARIDHDTVVVHADGVAQPVAVRYAWADNPEGANLYNQDGLPTAPFRTDDWPDPVKQDPAATKP